MENHENNKPILLYNFLIIDTVPSEIRQENVERLEEEKRKYKSEVQKHKQQILDIKETYESRYLRIYFSKDINI